MSSLMPILVGVLERGCMGSFLVMAFYLSSRIMKFDDFTLEGSFGLGGALATFALLKDLNPWASLLLGMLGGAMAGALTAVLHSKFQFNKLIAGVVVATMLFSVNLSLNGPNIALPSNKSIFNGINHWEYGISIFLILFSLIGAAFLALFMKTEIGYLIKATGLNRQFVTSLGKSTTFYLILTLSLSNGMSALAGGMMVQYAGFYSAFGNVGMLISALAGCILGEIFNGPIYLMCIIGSMLYQLIIAMTIEFQVNPSWQKLITGLLIIFLLVLKKKDKGAIQYAQT